MPVYLRLNICISIAKPSIASIPLINIFIGLMVAENNFITCHRSTGELLLTVDESREETVLSWIKMERVYAELGAVCADQDGRMRLCPGWLCKATCGNLPCTGKFLKVAIYRTSLLHCFLAKSLLVFSCVLRSCSHIDTARWPCKGNFGVWLMNKPL